MKTTLKENLDEFVDRTQQAAGSNLECIALYGSAARSDFNEQYSDLNLLVVLRDASGGALDQVAPVVAWWTHELQHRPPLVTTATELSASADVFAIETLDLVANHRVLAGQDVIAGLDVPMDLHRVQLEHELRTVLLKLRQHYVLSRGNERELQAALAKSSSSVVTLFRHALIALGRPTPTAKHDVVAAVATLEGIDAAPLQAALDLREGRRVESGVDRLYHRYMEAIGALVRFVDQCVPKASSQAK